MRLLRYAHAVLLSAGFEAEVFVWDIDTLEVPCCIVLCCTVLYCAVPCCTVLYRAVPCCTVPLEYLEYLGWIGYR